MKRRWFLAALGLAPFARRLLPPAPPETLLVPVTGDGVFAYSSGMRVRKSATGVYDFMFDAAPSSAPSMVVTAVDYARGTITLQMERR